MCLRPFTKLDRVFMCASMGRWDLTGISLYLTFLSWRCLIFEGEAYTKAPLKRGGYDALQMIQHWWKMRFCHMCGMSGGRHVHWHIWWASRWIESSSICGWKVDLYSIVLQKAWGYVGGTDIQHLSDVCQSLTKTPPANPLPRDRPLRWIRFFLGMEEPSTAKFTQLFLRNVRQLKKQLFDSFFIFFPVKGFVLKN